MRLKPLLILVGLAAALAAGPALAGDKDKGPLTSDKFVTKAAQTGMAEVELGKLALEKSQNAEVRAFAQRMVKDHGKANEELKTIAQGKNVTVPKTLDAKHQSMVDALKAKSGKEFDAEYAHHMSMGHGDAVALFKDASKEKSLDHELSAFAEKTLPTLEEHKGMADKLASSRMAALKEGDRREDDKYPYKKE
jgi:putative membrane protein